MATVACTRCSALVPEEQTFYDSEARLICGSCQAGVEVEELDARGQKALKSAALGALACGFIGFCCNPVGIVTLLGLSSAIGVVTGFGRQDDEFKSANGWVFAVAIVALIILVLQSLYLALQILGLGATLLSG